MLLLSLAFSCGQPDVQQAENKGSIQKIKSENKRDDIVKFGLEQLDNTRGLSNSSVNCIFQDSQNLLWIGTWDGLNRYDGSNFRIFRSEPSNKNSLSNQVVLKVGEDRTGNIWVLTMHGINRYDKKTDQFTSYYFSRKDKPPVSESEFNMALDPDGNVFCAVKEWGIGYFDGKDFRKIEGDFLSGMTVRKMSFSDNGKLIVLFENGLLKLLEVRSDKSLKTISKPQMISGNIKSFETLTDGAMCLLKTDGQAMIRSASGENRRIDASEKIDEIVAKLSDGLVFSARSGYFMADFNGAKVEKEWLQHLKNQKLTTLICGSENILWSGTDGDGVFKIYPIRKSFHLVSKAQLPELDGGIVRAFVESGDHFWVATKGKGLLRLPKNFYKIPESRLSPERFHQGNSGLNNAVYALFKGQDDLVFIGTDGEGLAVFDEKKDKIIPWNAIEGSGEIPGFRSVYAIHQDKEGEIWLGTNGFGMLKCRIVRTASGLKVSEFGKFTASGAGSLSSNIVFSIVPKDENQLWIGTRLGGLNLFDKRTGKFLAFKNTSGDNESLSSDDILSLATDARGNLWVGTSFGLNRLKKLTSEKASFERFTTDNGLPNNTIHGIISDGTSNLWLSTNFGLSNFVVGSGKFLNYSRSEGLQNNEFADGAAYLDPETGFVFMGGIKGFNYFLPQNIKESTVIPDLLIDYISGQNQAVPYAQGLVISPDSKTFPSIELKHNQNFFDVKLSALTYTNNEKCQYAYQLSGFDKGWNVIDNRKMISFTNVPPGQYSLDVKWSNSDGVWTEPVRAIDLRIRPVWWQSNVAMAIYLALAIGFILFVISYNRKRQSLRQNILIRKKEEELHETRLEFFTNIAHEFLTPLTLILGPIQKLSETPDLSDGNKKFIKLVQRNSSRLLFLTKQLLEFRKAEHEYLEITVKQFDMVGLAEQIAELFDDWALEKDVEYHFDLPSELTGWFDKDKVEKILFNLLSNAFKYTPDKGQISVLIRKEESLQSRLNITITNTGKGIPKEKLESLFDRFFLADTNKASDTEMFRTGIGLAYIKKLVTVMRGEIEVSSVPDEETRFTVLLPCDEASFVEKEMDRGESQVLISRHLQNILDKREEEEEAVPEKLQRLDRLEQSRKNILIVEDEKEIHAFLKDLLSEKYNIITAFNGLEALEKMEREVPDLIISDVMMPEMDGVDLCKKVKTDLRTCHVPFIMLTAKDNVIHRIEGLESGANSYIPKPFYPDHLLIRIRKLLEEKELILKHFTQDAVVDDFSSLPIESEAKDFIKSIVGVIRNNVDNEHLQSAFIEKELGISSSQLYRKTKEIFNLSPGDLIRTIRLKYAAELLRKNEMTVSEICYKSGFNNRSYFYREFNKMYSVTPKNYQIQYKNRTLGFTTH